MYIKREIEAQLQEGLNQFPVLLVTGSRQAGKSTLLKKLFPDFDFVSLDDPMFRKEAVKDPGLFLAQHPAPLIIDEIQYAPELLSYIKMNVDKDRDRYGQYVLTGSQVFALMAGVSESLAGRIGIFELFPLTWQELQAPNDPDGAYHMMRGFYPELHKQGNIDVNRWMASYFSTYVERDVRQIKAISDLSRFEAFVATLATRAGHTLNLSKIATSVGITQPTAKSWLSILESTYIIRLLQPYYKNPSKRIRRAPKLYFVDTGLLCYLLGIYSEKELIRHPFAGAIFENMVVMDIVKQLAYLPRRIKCYYWNPTDAEVDLIVEGGNDLFAFEIKYAKQLDLHDATNLKRFKKEYPNAKAYLLSLREESHALTKDVDLCYWADAFKTISQK